MDEATCDVGLWAGVGVGRDPHARVEVKAPLHDGVRDAREWLGRLGLVGLARIVRGLEGASLNPGEGHGFARAARGRRLEPPRVVFGFGLDVDAIKAEEVEMYVHIEARPRQSPRPSRHVCGFSRAQCG